LYYTMMGMQREERAMRSSILKRLAWVPGLLLCAGCGVGVQISGSPITAAPEQLVTFHVTVTNHGICPVVSAVALVPFASDAQLAGEPGPQFIDLFCNGALSGDGAHCSVQGDMLTCNFPIPTIGPFAPVAPTQPQSFQMTPPGLPAPIPCTASPGTIQCQIPDADRQAFSIQNFQRPAGPLAPAGPPPCIPGPPPFDVICFPPEPLAGGATASFDLPLNGPLAPGAYRTLAFLPQSDGVCQGGTNPGVPCSTIDDSPCTGTCQVSICTSGTNTGDGCAIDSDCGTNGVCQACRSQSGETAFLPLGCATTNVSPPAPAASRAGLLAVTVVLFALGAFLLRRRQSRTS
jgi:hypothetical protein